MDILVPDIWLRDYLKTKASQKDIAKYLSLCGPSVERIVGQKEKAVYLIEITTNRVDSASIFGIAREAAVILPRFKIAAKLAPQHIKTTATFQRRVHYLSVIVDKKLCSRFTAVLIKDVKIGASPKWLQERLELVGVRPINNVVDISNYIMHDLGQPVHTFDYDKIQGRKMVLRESRPNEKITTLDGKNYTLSGGDVVIEDGAGRLIDLAGIMGGSNSAVDAETRNVLLFVQTYNPVNIRRTSMTLPKRTEAAVLFEKGVDSEGVVVAIKKAIDLFVKLTEGKPEKKILDIYPSPYKPKKFLVDINFINKILGVELTKKEIGEILKSLGFEVSIKGKLINVQVPSFRSKDIAIPEDIVEEVARIYGYQNLDSEIMTGAIPEPLSNSPFEFEMKIKRFMSSLGGDEIYTLSLVSADMAGKNALKLKNPLGDESEYLRVSLMPSLIQAARDNLGEKEPFHIFEIANTYKPKGKESLPEEKMTLSGVFFHYSFREAKGIVESLLSKLNIEYKEEIEDNQGFIPSQRIIIKTKSGVIGEFGVVSEDGLIYYEFPVEKLREVSHDFGRYVPTSKYPPQIEDITFVFPERTKVGEVLTFISKVSKYVNKAALIEIYENSYTFRVWYLDPTKTLRDQEVEKIREKVVKEVKQKFGGTLKS